MRFLFVRPEICPWVSRFPTSGFLQIPPHDGHPCLRLYPSHYRADSGLSPVRNVRRQAHQIKRTVQIERFFFFTADMAIISRNGCGPNLNSRELWPATDSIVRARLQFKSHLARRCSRFAGRILTYEDFWPTDFVTLRAKSNYEE